MTALIGIDIGTTGCKVVAYKTDGELVTAAYREYTSGVEDNGVIGLDSELVFHCVVECIRRVVGFCDGISIAGVSVSAMTDTVTPISIDGQALMCSIIPFDRRGIDEVSEFSAKFSAMEVFENTGMTISASHTLFKILWLKKHHPEIIEKTWKFLCYEDFILWRLGAEPVSSYSTVSKTMLFDKNSRQWCKKMLDYAGIREEQLPKPVRSGIKVGAVSKDAAEQTGLKAGTPLVSGGFDQACCGLACSVVRAGDVLDTTGTNEILFFIPDPKKSERLLESGMNYSPHVLEDIQTSYALIFNAGGAFRWCRDTFFDISKQAYPDIYTHITDGLSFMPKKSFFLPFLTGIGTPEMLSMGKAAFWGLSFQTDKFEIAQTILEGITYELRNNLELIYSIIGKNVDSLTSVGGAAKSGYWLQLKANICNVNVRAPISFEPGACGAAILAGSGVGIFRDPEQATEVFLKQVKFRCFEPQTSIQVMYESGYRRYCRIRQNYINMTKILSDEK